MKKIDKAAVLGCLFLLLLLPVRSNGNGVDLRLFGGAGLYSPQDINKGAKGWFDLHAGFLTSWGYTQEGEVKPIKWGMDLGGDLLLRFTPQVALGIGSGYLQAIKNSEASFAKGSSTLTASNRTKISAVPIRASLFFTIPMSGAVDVSLNFGAAYYLAKFDWDWDSGAMGELHDSVKANNFGYHGGIGFEFTMSPGLAFFFEGTARYVKIKGFEGTEKGREGPDSWESEGTLYYVEGSEYPSLLLRKTLPAGYRVSREAEVDLSGVALIAGLKMKF